MFRCYLSDIYREAADPGPSVLLDGPGDLEVILGAGGVTLESELGEEEAELPGGGVHGPHALRVVRIIGGVVGRLQGQAVAKTRFSSVK